MMIVSRIPPGRVATYGDVARLAGKPRASRAAGNLMRAAEMPGLPYHRVIAANGRLGGYGANPQLKAALLSAEGIVIRRGRIVGFRHVRWTGQKRAKGRGQRAKERGKG
jgi:O-6-methylguanine DNA methyltransferase